MTIVVIRLIRDRVIGKVRRREEGREKRGKSNHKQAHANEYTPTRTYCHTTVRTSWNDSKGSFCLFGHTKFPLNASTISNASHRVPSVKEERRRRRRRRRRRKRRRREEEEEERRREEKRRRKRG